MNAIEKAYCEGFDDGVSMNEFARVLTTWQWSQAKETADRYEALLAGWKDKAKRLRDAAQQAYSDGRDGTAISIQEQAIHYEIIVRQLEGITDE